MTTTVIGNTAPDVDWVHAWDDDLVDPAPTDADVPDEPVEETEPPLDLDRLITIDPTAGLDDATPLRRTEVGGEYIPVTATDPAEASGSAGWAQKDWRDWWGQLPDSIRVAFAGREISGRQLRLLAILYAVGGSDRSVHGTPDRIAQMTGMPVATLEEDLRGEYAPLTPWVYLTVREQPDPFGTPVGRVWWELTLTEADGQWTRVRAWWLLHYHPAVPGNWVARTDITDQALLGVLKVSSWAGRDGVAVQAAADLHRWWEPGDPDTQPADPDGRARARARARADDARAYRRQQNAAVRAGLLAITRRSGGRAEKATRIAVDHPDWRPATYTRRTRVLVPDPELSTSQNTAA